MFVQRCRCASPLVALGVAGLLLGCGGSEAAGQNTADGAGGGSGPTSTVTHSSNGSGTTDSQNTTGSVGTTGNTVTATTSSATTSSVGTGGMGSGGTTSAGSGGTTSAGSGGTTSAGSGGTTTTTTGGSGGTAGTSAGMPEDVARSAGCDTPTTLESGRASIEVGNKTREYILYIPDDYDPSHPHKLVFGWHPWGGSASQTEMMGFFGLESVSQGQAILVAPEGQDYQDNGLGWGNENGEDIDFYHAMRERFSAGLCIDENRVFSTGFSFGAMFSFTLACSQGSGLRAIAPQAGNATTSGRCEDGPRSVATMAFIGSDDTLLNGHRQAVDIFVERNGCSTEPVTLQTSWCDGLAAQYEPCSCIEYPKCDDGYPVIACEYNAGHQFAPNSGGALWEFFSRF